MDIKELKSEVRRYIAAIKKDGKDFSFVALIPTYPGLEDTSYILQVKAKWMENTDCKKIIDYLVPKMFEVLEQPVRMFINRIDLFDEKGDVFCMSNDLIIVNKIHYSPAQYATYSTQWAFA